MKRGSSSARPKAGRPFGENSMSGKKMMTRYTKPTTSGGPTMRISGMKARKNGVKNLAGRAGSASFIGNPNVRKKSN